MSECVCLCGFGIAIRSWGLSVWWIKMYLHRMGICVNLISPECVALNTFVRMSDSLYTSMSIFVCLGVQEAMLGFLCLCFPV